jgi:hypothetical protein
MRASGRQRNATSTAIAPQPPTIPTNLAQEGTKPLYPAAK